MGRVHRFSRASPPLGAAQGEPRGRPLSSEVRPGRVFLVGFMGAGKTVVGAALAEGFQVPFVDLDERIEAHAGLSVREIFDQQGEAGFRALERELLEQAVALPQAVVATGGGTFTFVENQRLIQREGLSVWLNPSFATIVQRIGSLGKHERPLFRDEIETLALYRARLPAYQLSDLRVDVGPQEGPQEVAARIALWLRQR